MNEELSRTRCTAADASACLCLPLFFTRWHRPTALSWKPFPFCFAGADWSRARSANILTVERQCHAILLARLIGMVLFLYALQRTALSLTMVCWLESPSLTCCPAVVWGSSVPGLLIAVPATQNCSLYYTDVSSHPCKGKERPFQAFSTVPAWGASETEKHCSFDITLFNICNTIWRQ